MSNKNETIYSNEILKKGVIYKCYSKTDDKIYYGSTKNLPQRMNSHSTKNGNKTHSNYIVGTLEYEILEEHENINRRDLEMREKIYIENHKADMENPVICINKNIPRQTQAEYSHKRYKEKAEFFRQKQREYYWANAEKERARCSKRYYNSKDTILEKRKNELVFCEECKKSLRKDTFGRHKRSATHIHNCLNKNYGDNSKVI